MKVIGIICEYNPFHNGHVYHLKRIKESYPNSLIILVLNGYFLERGEISVLTKEDKTRIALDNNVDIVLELPVLFGTQAADIFANKALEILNKYGVKRIIFGSETNNLKVLEKIVDIQRQDGFDISVKSFLDQGLNYPTALAKATGIEFDFQPNDLLGISYLKAIKNNNYDIDVTLIKRTSNYHDTTSTENIVSASNIRKKLINKESINNYVPNEVIPQIKNINYDIYFKLLKEKIMTTDNLSIYLDVDEGIEYRLKKYIKDTNTLDEFKLKIKTKRYTYNKINRMFIHILLGIKKNNITSDYTKVLGFNKKGQDYLSKLNIDNNLDKGSSQYKCEITASIIYDLIMDTNTYLFEKQNKPIIVD